MSDEEFWLTAEVIKRGHGSAEEIARALDHVERALARAKALRAAMEQALLRRVKAHGSCVIGTIMYYAGYQTTNTAIEKFAVLDALLIHTRGDLATIASFLIAQPFKHGSIRDLLPRSTYSSLFRVGREMHLGRRLLRADVRFTGRKE
jgi:hypothetical protein